MPRVDWTPDPRRITGEAEARKQMEIDMNTSSTESFFSEILTIENISIVLLIIIIVFVVRKYNLISKTKDYKRTPHPDELLKWHDLKDKGVITEEEFEVHKKRILG